MSNIAIHPATIGDLDSIQDLDTQHIWHPCFHLAASGPAIPIVRGEGERLIAEDGREYLDMVSSWWVNLHGHCHPHIVGAISTQARTLDHVIFANNTHAPAARLAHKLAAFLPHTPRLFYSDNGSTSNEVAIKIAYQYWKNVGESKRTKILSFESDYHGETLGAMSVSGASVFLGPFKDLMFEINRLPFPETWEGDEEIDQKEAHVFEALEDYLMDQGDQTACVILEPLIQGAAGMRMCRPSFLKRFVERVQSEGILVIFDEVMTGFGRTGHLFACHKADVKPDLICLSKGITGGFLPLAATLCREDIFQTFIHEGYEKAFAHSHSYTANPIGCAAGLASLELFESEQTLNKIADIEAHYKRFIQDLQNTMPSTIHHRVMGGIMAFEIQTPKAEGYTSSLGPKLRQQLQDRGLLIRPLGNTLYLLPPYCVSHANLDHTFEVIKEVLKDL